VFSIDAVTVDHVTGRDLTFEVLFTNDALTGACCDEGLSDA